MYPSMNILKLQRLVQAVILVGIAAYLMLCFYYQSVSQVTSKSSATNLDDVFISVKTSRKFYKSRLPVIIKTWFQLAKEQTWFITDMADMELQAKTNGHLVTTDCVTTHNVTGLCCKMSAEFDAYIKSGKKWFCHMDDDNYLNVPRLVHVLNDYSPQKKWYLGRRNTKDPVERVKNITLLNFSCALGGAGFCLSQALALKMKPVVGGGKFAKICKNIGYADDATMGYVVGYLMRTPLTEILAFHSHLESLNLIQQYTFHEQITFSYERENIVEISGFDKQTDKTRFLSIHCFLFPHFRFCPKQWQRVSFIQHMP